MVAVGGVWRGRHAKCCHGDHIDWQGRLIRKEEWETGGRRRAVHLRNRLGQSEDSPGVMRRVTFCFGSG